MQYVEFYQLKVDFLWTFCEFLLALDLFGNNISWFLKKYIYFLWFWGRGALNGPLLDMVKVHQSSYCTSALLSARSYCTTLLPCLLFSILLENIKSLSIWMFPSISAGSSCVSIHWLTYYLPLFCIVCFLCYRGVCHRRQMWQQCFRRNPQGKILSAMDTSRQRMRTTQKHR